MGKYLVWTKATGLKGGKVREADSSYWARQDYQAAIAPSGTDIIAIMARALETSEGELGYWTQGDNGPVWTQVA